MLSICICERWFVPATDGVFPLWRRFRTENGIAQQEQGISYPGEAQGTGSYVKEGVIEYPLDNGGVLVINYVADENGFAVLNPEELEQALPTPPPTQYPPPAVPGAGVDVPVPLPEYNPFLQARSRQ